MSCFFRADIGLGLAIFFAASTVFYSGNESRCRAGASLQAAPAQPENQKPKREWNFVRGPNFDGVSVETELLDQWPAAGPPIVWHRTLGQGYSSFTGRGDKVFTQYQTLTGQFLVCLNAFSGQTIWEYRHSWPYDSAGMYPGPQSTPTLSGDFVYFTSPQGLVGCVKLETGEVLWQFNLMERFASQPVEFGYSCSPVIVDGKVFLPVGGKNASIVALDARDGSTVWQSGNEPISHASAFPIRWGQRNLIVGYLRNVVQLFDADTGELLSTLELSSGYDEHSSWPIYREPYLWLSAPFRAGSMSLELLDSQPPTLVTRRLSRWLSNDVCSSVLVGDHLYGFDLVDVQSKVHRPSRGLFRCLDFQSGDECWQNGSLKERRSLDGNSSNGSTPSIGHAAVIAADGKLILLNDTGELIMAWADPQSYREIGRVRLLGGEICWTQPMLLDGFVYVRNHSQVVCTFVGLPERLKLDSRQLSRAAELPMPIYRDWAAIILSVEPEYAMTSPSLEWITYWFGVTLVLGWIVAPVAAILLKYAVATLQPHSDSHSWYVGGWTATAFLIGILGTTFLSRWLDEFIFTWQLTLAIGFQWMVSHAKLRRRDPLAHPVRSRLACAGFLILIVTYFVVCRRLSLAFEWSFLMGFPAALPFLLADRAVADNRSISRRMLQWLLTGSAYAAFYWMGAGIMLWKYQE